MKIQCDVCNAAAAAVFCAADEAALCGSCDRRVHQANKLASRHPRVSLLRPPTICSKQSHHGPLCDICQERRAVLFCLQDRAVLCNDCDVPVHNANEHTQKHSRFLITRVKLSSSAPHYPTPPSPDVKFDDMNPKPAPISEAISSPLSSMMGRESCDQWAGGGGTGGGWSSGSDGMLSEVLMMEMPDGGWHFEDSVDSCSTSVASFGFTKFAGHSMNFALQNDDGFAASPYTELGNRPMRPLFIESTGIWVPDAPACELYPTLFSLPLDRQAVSYKETGRHLKKGDSFTVPRVISPSRQDSTLLGFSCSADHIWRR